VEASFRINHLGASFCPCWHRANVTSPDDDGGFSRQDRLTSAPSIFHPFLRRGALKLALEGSKVLIHRLGTCRDAGSSTSSITLPHNGQGCPSIAFHKQALRPESIWNGLPFYSIREHAAIPRRLPMLPLESAPHTATKSGTRSCHHCRTLMSVWMRGRNGKRGRGM
jgi:hypothetical protein